MSKPPLAAALAAILSPAEFLHVLGLVRADIERFAAAVARAQSAGDEAALRRAAHSLAGVAGQVEATGLEQACKLTMTGKADGSGIAPEADAVLAEIAALAGAAA